MKSGALPIIFATKRASRLVILPTGSGPRLAWAVAGETAGLPFRPVAFVDAEDGQVLLRYDASHAARAANVYEFNPKKTPTPKPVTLENTNDTTVIGLENATVVSRTCVDKKAVRSVSIGGTRIRAHLCDLEPTVKANAAGDYTDVAPDTTGVIPEDPFAELSMFFHTQRRLPIRAFDRPADHQRTKDNGSCQSARSGRTLKRL